MRNNARVKSRLHYYDEAKEQYRDDDANDYELEQDVVALGLADPSRFLK